jgi:hypothetical protein
LNVNHALQTLPIACDAILQRIAVHPRHVWQAAKIAVGRHVVAFGNLGLAGHITCYRKYTCTLCTATYGCRRDTTRQLKCDKELYRSLSCLILSHTSSTIVACSSQLPGQDVDFRPQRSLLQLPHPPGSRAPIPHTSSRKQPGDQGHCPPLSEQPVGESWHLV